MAEDNNNKLRKSASHRLSKQEIYERNTTFQHVNKVNRHLVQYMKLTTPVYRPPDKA